MVAPEQQMVRGRYFAPGTQSVLAWQSEAHAALDRSQKARCAAVPAPHLRRRHLCRRHSQGKTCHRNREGKRRRGAREWHSKQASRASGSRDGAEASKEGSRGTEIGMGGRSGT